MYEIRLARTRALLSAHPSEESARQALLQLVAGAREAVVLTAPDGAVLARGLPHVRPAPFPTAAARRECRRGWATADCR